MAVGYLRDLYPFLDAMADAARASAVALRREIKKARTPIRNAARPPGEATPLWNELARMARSHLTRWGDKVKLARDLGITRQRLHKLLVEKSACPDAECTLRLLVWVAKRAAPPPEMNSQVAPAARATPKEVRSQVSEAAASGRPDAKGS